MGTLWYEGSTLRFEGKFTIIYWDDDGQTPVSGDLSILVTICEKSGKDQCPPLGNHFDQLQGGSDHSLRSSPTIAGLQASGLTYLAQEVSVEAFPY